MTDLESGYQDAWNTPGYTAQWPNLPDATHGSPSWLELGLPAGMTGLPLAGEWYDQWGPANGTLLFTPSVDSVVVNGIEVSFAPYRVWLRNGQLPEGLAVPVPADGATVSPATWEWTVTGRVGSHNVAYTVSVPSTVSPFNLVVNGSSTTPSA